MKSCLIVGDGNFSFALAFRRRYPPKSWSITATSYETKDEVTLRFGANENVQLLKQLGVNTLHGIDGTTLDQYGQFNGNSFQCIIFNFPHCGGKSNIKRNQALLQGYFKASAKLLDPLQGEVWVTLCKGQGGTQSDDLSRGYENSWKIVKAAAEGGLCLYKVTPFEVIDWPGYCQTGYRGADKGFMLEGALTHIFTCPRVDRDLWKKDGRPCTVNACTLCCSSEEEVIRMPPELRMNECFEYPLLDQEWHPVCRSRNTMVDILRSSLLKQFNAVADNRGTSKCTIHEKDSECRASYSELSPVEVQHTDGNIPGQSSCVFESTLEQRLVSFSSSSLSPSDGQCLIVSGPVIRRVGVSLDPNNQPLSHQLLCTIPQSREADSCFDKLDVQHFETLCIQALCRFLQIEMSELQMMRKNKENHSSVRHWENVVLIFKGLTIASQSRHDPGGPSKTRTNGVPMLYCVFELDSLALLKYNIPDVRMLWSKDQRFHQQFATDTSNGGKCMIFEPFSLFPPSYVHDISFWVVPDTLLTGRESQSTKPADDFSGLVETVEARLSSLVRETCGLVVASLRNTDVYIAAPTSRVYQVSLCFRLVYSSSDSPVSYSSAHTLQDALRTKVESILGWELR